MLLQGWRSFVVSLAAFLAWAAPAYAAEVDDPELAKALAYYERSDFTRAAADLAKLVESPQLKPDERLRAREALGVSNYVLGRVLDARHAFTALLLADPTYQPDPLYVPPEIVAFVADVKRSQAAAVTSSTLATPSFRQILRPTLSPGGAGFSSLDFLPFGAAQFRKGHGTRGTALAVAQGVTLGLNIGLYYYRTCELKATCAARYYPPENVSQAQHLQTYQFIAGSVFIATAALGVIDGVLLPVIPDEKLSLRPMGSGVGIAWEVR